MTTIDQNFWLGKSVLVTGHTGFKGAWLSLWLKRLGAKVHGLSLSPNTNPSLFTVLGLENTLDSSHIGDINNLEFVESVVAQSKPDIAFHLAAQALVRHAYREPIETISTNVVGTAHVLDALAKCDDCRVAIAITTDKVYENKEWMWPYREVDRLGGHEPYGASKAAAELIINAYRKSYFNPRGKTLWSVRAGNVIGGGDWSEDRLIPDAIRSFIKGEDLVLRNPAATRPWQHVFEPLLGYMLLAQMNWDGPNEKVHELNFGPDITDIRAVSEVAQNCVKHWGPGANWRVEAPKELIKESQLLSLDNALARQYLGWTPKWTFDDCIQHTISWYKAHQDGADMLAYSNNQIDEFNE